MVIVKVKVNGVFIDCYKKIVKNNIIYVQTTQVNINNCSDDVISQRIESLASVHGCLLNSGSRLICGSGVLGVIPSWGFGLEEVSRAN
ncbi:MAG: hypothetical protein QM504_10290 [Pseudomonadota bacterium]